MVRQAHHERKARGIGNCLQAYPFPHSVISVSSVVNLPFALSLSKGSPFMVRQAHHERKAGSPRAESRGVGSCLQAHPFSHSVISVSSVVNPVRPELVEGLFVHGSTGSPRTESRLATSGKQARHERKAGAPRADSSVRQPANAVRVCVRVVHCSAKRLRERNRIAN